MITSVNDLFEENELKYYLKNKLSSLNSLLEGFGYSELIILAGRPRNGSAILLRNLAVELSKVSNLFYISPSISKHKLFRSLNVIRGINNNFNKILPNSKEKTILEKQWTNHSIFFLDNIYSLNKIVNWIEIFSSEHKNPFIIIENLNDIVIFNSNKYKTIESYYLEILRSFKYFSIEKQIPIMLHVPLPEIIEETNIYEPQIQDLHFIGKGLSLLDKLIFTFRVNLYKQSFTLSAEHVKDIIRVLVPINKSGKTGFVSMEFDPDNLHFKEIINHEGN